MSYELGRAGRLKAYEACELASGLRLWPAGASNYEFEIINISTFKPELSK
jgi:hypothetical protein